VKVGIHFNKSPNENPHCKGKKKEAIKQALCILPPHNFNSMYLFFTFDIGCQDLCNI